MAWQFTVRHGFRRLLQLQQLIVHTSAFLWNNEKRIDGTLWTSSLITSTSHNTDNLTDMSFHTSFLSQIYTTTVDCHHHHHYKYKDYSDTSRNISGTLCRKLCHRLYSCATNKANSKPHQLFQSLLRHCFSPCETLFGRCETLFGSV